MLKFNDGMHTHTHSLTRRVAKWGNDEQDKAKQKEKSMRSAMDWNWNILVCVIRVFYTTLFPHNFGVCHFFAMYGMTTARVMYECRFLFLNFLVSPSTIQFSSAFMMSPFEAKTEPARALTNTNAKTQYSKFNREWKRIHIYLYSTKTTNFGCRKPKMWEI